MKTPNDINKLKKKAEKLVEAVNIATSDTKRNQMQIDERSIGEIVPFIISVSNDLGPEK